jgi:hypothetical protein
MKNARPQTSEASALDKCNSNSIGRFSGTDNPRHLRGLHALRTRSQRREHLDLIAGCSNSPELVAELRRRGLDLPCQLVQDIDRDGRPIRRGVYFLTDSDRRKLNAWLRSRAKVGAGDTALLFGEAK